MNRISCVIGAHGAERWHTLARERAWPSTEGQGFHETILVYERDMTLAEVRNAGAAAAAGDWLLFLDADDELHRDFGREMRDSIDRIGGDGPLLFTPAVSYQHGRHAPPPRIWPRVPIEDGNWLVIGTLIPRRLFEEIGGFREWPLYEDWCLWQRAIRAGAEVVEVPTAVYLAKADPRSRNRAPARRVKVDTHHAIRRANYPELYEEER